MEDKEKLVNFFTWLNNAEELKYTEKGINFYVDRYILDNDQLFRNTS